MTEDQKIERRSPERLRMDAIRLLDRHTRVTICDTAAKWFNDYVVALMAVGETVTEEDTDTLWSAAVIAAGEK